jgi:hypothetical protein
LTGIIIKDEDEAPFVIEEQGKNNPNEGHIAHPQQGDVLVIENDNEEDIGIKLDEAAEDTDAEDEEDVALETTVRSEQHVFAPRGSGRNAKKRFLSKGF